MDRDKWVINEQPKTSPPQRACALFGCSKYGYGPEDTSYKVRTTLITFRHWRTFIFKTQQNAPRACAMNSIPAQITSSLMWMMILAGD